MQIMGADGSAERREDIVEKSWTLGHVETRNGTDKRADESFDVTLTGLKD